MGEGVGEMAQTNIHPVPAAQAFAGSPSGKRSFPVQRLSSAPIRNDGKSKAAVSGPNRALPF
jgi:hypothetical protein